MPYYRKDRKKWAANWIDASGKRQKVLFSTKKAATIFEARMKIEVEESKTYGKIVNNDLTLQQVVEKYLVSVSHRLKESSYKEEKQNCTKIVHHLKNEGVVYYHHLRADDIQDYVSYRKDTTTTRGTVPSNKTINHSIQAIKRATKYAKDNHLVNVDVLAKVKTLRVDHEEKVRILTKDEVRLIEKNSNSSTVKDEIFFLVRTGLRLSEMINLTIEDIDIENKIILVQSSKAKSRKTRHVPMSNAIFDQVKVKIADAINSKRKYLFVNSRGGKHEKRNVLRRFKRVLEFAKNDGVNTEDVNVHTLRKTYISHMIMAGQDVQKVMRIVGHSSYETMKKYLYLTQGYVNDIPEIF